MKKSVSRTLAMALATCMAAGTLAACGSSGSSAVASSAAESTADSTAASTESGTPDYSNEDPINIRIHNVRVRSIRPCSFPLKWRYGLTNFPIGTPRPQTNVSASLHCFVLDSASWDIAPVSRLNMCVLWKSWIAINRNERRNVNARSRNRYFQVKKCSSHLKPRRINAHKSF